MTAYVFLGPTLPIDAARSMLEAVYLPPVRHGDVWRVAAFRDPSSIAIIDGYFEHVPSVWHKEILWALSEGIPVFGASSMGALRASELEQFGMVGIGRIFAAYRDGVLPPYTDVPFEDDDEVAVVHGPAESGYLSSEAMVNIRCTLAKAADDGVIGRQTRDDLVSIAKGAFYKDRSYAKLLREAAGMAIPPNELESLRGWLPEGRVDQKREDAVALLRHLRDGGAGAPNARFRFERTTMWEHLLTAATEDPVETMVLTELRLEGPPYLEARQRALGLLPDPLAPPSGAAPETGTGPEAMARHIRRLARDETRRARTHLLIEPLTDTIIVARLRDTGEYERLASRARAKRDRLASLNVFPPDINDTDMTPEELTAWFGARFEHDGETDPTAWARRLDFEDALTFLRALAGEYLYVNGL
jgi:hypothetical protein